MSTDTAAIPANETPEPSEPQCDKLDLVAATTSQLLQLAELVDVKSPAARSKLKSKVKMALRMALAE